MVICYRGYRKLLYHLTICGNYCYGHNLQFLFLLFAFNVVPLMFLILLGGKHHAKLIEPRLKLAVENFKAILHFPSSKDLFCLILIF